MIAQHRVATPGFANCEFCIFGISSWLLANLRPTRIDKIMF